MKKKKIVKICFELSSLVTVFICGHR